VWALAWLLVVPGLFLLVLIVDWLERYFTYQLVADEVSVAWESAESADDLEKTVGRIVERVLITAR
jgi:hypothetical protein